MTIGIGFLCPDGIVLCADRQITSQGGFKFFEKKIFSHTDGWSLIFTYSGEPDAARIIFDKVCDGLETEMAKSNSRSPSGKALGALEHIFKNRNTKGLYTLIGIRFKGSGCCMFKTGEKKVLKANTDYIGSGDSSALRYLCNFLLHGTLNVYEAKILGSYIISVANRYIDGCSGGPDRAVLHTDGRIDEETGDPFPRATERFTHCEQEIGKVLREMLFTSLPRAIVT